MNNNSLNLPLFVIQGNSQIHLEAVSEVPSLAWQEIQDVAEVDDEKLEKERIDQLVGRLDQATEKLIKRRTSLKSFGRPQSFKPVLESISDEDWEADEDEPKQDDVEGAHPSDIVRLM